MTEIRIQPTGDGIEDVHLVEWLVEDGEQVAVGQALFTVESDKSVIEVEATVAGRISLAAAAGSMISPGRIVGRIG